MRHIPVEPPAFFHRGPSPLARLAFFGLVSLSLLFLDTRYRYLENIRQAVAVVLYPLQRAAQVPSEAVAYIGSYFVAQRTLVEENAALKRRLLEQGAAAQSFESARADNTRLKALVDVRARYGDRAAVVEVLYTGRDPFTQKLFVDKGTDAGIVAGAAVIDAQGVVGQVTRVLPYMSEVTLVTDKDHAVPVKVERSGVRSVLYGAGAGRAPELRFMSPNADIEPNDVLVTSGIDGTYPPGLAVARVATLERETGQMFARITTQPLAGVDRNEYLLVLARAATAPARPDEPVDADTAKKSGRRRRGG
jgi:rod shape-determining protein MreC